jgi:hypothetical protein
MSNKKLSKGKFSETHEDIIYEEFIKALDKWSEKATTSPSGRHLGHYKILIRLKVFDKEDNNINNSEKLLRLYYKIATIAIKVGTPHKDGLKSLPV